MNDYISLDKIENFDKLSATDKIRKLKEKIKTIRNYKPKVAIIGKSGAGKSTLINALFKDNVSKVSHVGTGTTDVQEFDYEGLTLLDFPGLSDISKDSEDKFVELYKERLKDVDLAIWVISADDRANAPDVEAYNLFLRPEKDRMPTVFVLSGCDKFVKFPEDPEDEWDYSLKYFGPLKNVYLLINEKICILSDELNISTKYIVPISIKPIKKTDGYKTYNIEKLVEKIIDVLPNEKKYSFTREVNEENVTQKAQEDAEKGVWESIKDFAGDSWDKVKDTVSDVIMESAPQIFKTATRWLRNLF